MISVCPGRIICIGMAVVPPPIAGEILKVHPTLGQKHKHKQSSKPLPAAQAHWLELSKVVELRLLCLSCDCCICFALEGCDLSV